MQGKRSPILPVILILVVAAVFLWGSMAAVFLLSGASSRIPTLSLGPKIGVIPIEGAIEESRELLSQIVRFREDSSIKAIILRVDSPGGLVGPSQEIHREILKTNKEKHVVVSMGDVAASGGYYIASAADRIVANPGTIVGSIGVIMEFLQLQELLDKAGVGLEVLKSGEFKDVGSPHREMTPRERELLMDLIVDIQEQFIRAVAQGRGLPVERVREIADGRVFSGSRAKELGLVDHLGNFRDAVDLANRLGGIRGEAELVYPSRPVAGWLDYILENAASGLFRAVSGRLQTRLEYRWQGLPRSSQ